MRCRGNKDASEIAEQAGFIVVYPDAIGQHWDARRGSQPETTHDNDSVVPYAVAGKALLSVTDTVNYWQTLT